MAHPDISKYVHTYSYLYIYMYIYVYRYVYTYTRLFPAYELLRPQCILGSPELKAAATFRD